MAALAFSHRGAPPGFPRTVVESQLRTEKRRKFPPHAPSRDMLAADVLNASNFPALFIDLQTDFDVLFRKI